MRSTVVAIRRPLRIEGLLGWAPFGALAIAALERPLRLPILLVLAAAYLIARRVDGNPGAILTAALPIALVLATGAALTPQARPGALDCATLQSPPAVWRLFAATGLVALVVLLARDSGRPLAALGWRRTGRGLGALSIVLFAVLGTILVALGEALGRQFFGDFTFALAGLGFVVPALLFGLSNAVAEETAYRGGVLTWLGPGLGPAAASAIVFGLAHTGPDFVGSPLPVVAAMIAISFVAWAVLRRTGSLALLVAVHAPADIPLYLFMACRAG